MMRTSESSGAVTSARLACCGFVDDQHRRAGRGEGVDDTGHEAVRSVDGHEAGPQVVVQAHQPPQPGGRRHGGQQRERGAEDGDRREHLPDGHHPACAVVRGDVTVADRGGRGDGPVQAGRERNVLGRGEQHRPGDDEPGSQRQQRPSLVTAHPV
jgi:hypothetical protein